MIYIRNLLHGTGTMRNFREIPKGEVRRIPIPRTPVNRELLLVSELQAILRGDPSDLLPVFRCSGLPLRDVGKLFLVCHGTVTD